MKKGWVISFALGILTLLTACTSEPEQPENERVKVGVMLSDAGLGDQSFSDLSFAGLEKARDELGITFDYRELEETGTYAQGFEQLIADGQDLVIGIGFNVQEDMEAVAARYPQQQFLLIDTISELPNIHNVTFKEEEGSYLIGALAAMKSESGVIGFIGGDENEVIQRFETGFTEGAQWINPEIEVLSAYAGNFGDDRLGATIASGFIEQGADFIYPAAGFTGVGAILAAQQAGVYAFGVDSDQFFLAEDTIVSSMQKRVDTAVYEAIEEIVDAGALTEKNKMLGIRENGVSLAPVRVISLTAQQQQTLDKLQQALADGTQPMKQERVVGQ